MVPINKKDAKIRAYREMGIWSKQKQQFPAIPANFRARARKLVKSTKFFGHGHARGYESLSRIAIRMPSLLLI